MRVINVFALSLYLTAKEIEFNKLNMEDASFMSNT